jgi:gas vesicle protein
MRDYTEYEEQYWRPERNSGRNLASEIKWLLIGAGIGAGAALLLAPVAGSDLRIAIAHGCRRALRGIATSIGGGISRGTQELREHGSNLLNFSRHQTG